MSQPGDTHDLLAWDSHQGVLSIAHGGETTFYRVERVACDIGGSAFALSPLARSTVYHARLGSQAETACECPAFLVGRPCRHLRALSLLILYGKIQLTS